MGWGVGANHTFAICLYSPCDLLRFSCFHPLYSIFFRLHCNKTADPSQEYPKKTTDELMREFGVYDDNDGEDMHHVG